MRLPRVTSLRAALQSTVPLFTVLLRLRFLPREPLTRLLGGVAPGSGTICAVRRRPAEGPG
jgi:hypothetical protein